VFSVRIRGGSLNVLVFSYSKREFDQMLNRNRC
jgi:hypothetical protein